MEITARDPAVLEKAVNDAASRAIALWISFALFAALTIITTGSVTHKHLLLDLPLKLPVLAVEVPLLGYFVVVPLFFVVYHFYGAVQLEALSDKIAHYNEVMRDAY